MSTDPISFDDTAIAFATRTDEELRKARWLFRLMGNGAVVDIGTHLTRMALRIGLPVQSLVKQTIYTQFCGGETLAESMPVVDRLAEQQVSTILDYGVEAKESDAEFDANVEEQIRAIQFANGRVSVPTSAARSPAMPPSGCSSASRRARRCPARMPQPSAASRRA